MALKLFPYLLLASLLSACGYYNYAGPLRPQQQQQPSMSVADDGSITYTQDRFEVRLKAMTDEELNRQFAPQSQSGPTSTNPYTFGNTQFWEGEKGRERFVVFHLSVKNYAYPKVKIDPANIVLRADNKREYWSLNFKQMDTYYRAYAIGYRGNEYQRYKERQDTMLRTLFKNEEIFSGQEVDGFVIFPDLHPDVSKVRVVLQDVVLRFDFRNEPVETVNIEYLFTRDIGKIYRDGKVVLSKAE